jgi:glycine cleavage system H protein
VDFKVPGADGQPTTQPIKTYDYTPHAGGADFDDSRWEVLEPTTLDKRRSTGRLCFNWYRIQLTIPERAGSFDPWLARVTVETADNRWRVGYTKFALRMLGEMVDVQFERAPGSAVQPGDILGTVEGFKAISDVYCVGTGRFDGGNPALATSLGELVEQPYDTGWLYEFSGEPDGRAMDVDGYRALLDATIDRMLEKQQQQESKDE